MKRLRRAVLPPVLAGLVLATVASPVLNTATAEAADPVTPGPQLTRSFVDPTAQGFGTVAVGQRVYVAPYAKADYGLINRISIGNDANIQDSVLLSALKGPITIGNQAILAHNSAVLSRSMVGVGGTCPLAAASCASFVGFNAVIDGAIIERDAMVQAMARVAPGVRIPSGRKVQPGRYVQTQAQVSAKTDPMTAADRDFMHGVIEVNTEFAEAYSKLAAVNPFAVRGVSVSPVTRHNPGGTPTFAGWPITFPATWFRVIGDVRFGQTKAQVDLRVAPEVSLRADEGNPFTVASVEKIRANATIHALEESDVILGSRQTLGQHSVIHGGGPRGAESTRAGNDFELGRLAVFFRSQAGANVTVGDKSLVQQTSLPSGTNLPRCTILVAGVTSPHEWCDVDFPGVE